MFGRHPNFSFDRVQIKILILHNSKLHLKVLSTIVINVIPNKRNLISLKSTAKINANAWQSAESRPWMAGGTPLVNDSDMSETEVIIRKGELLVGVLDKTHYGATPYGLIHCMYEVCPFEPLPLSADLK